MTAPRQPVLLLGREPAVWTSLAATLLVFVNLYVLPDLNLPIQQAINAFLVALAGLYTAWKIRDEKLLAILSTVFTTGVALFVAFGVDLSQEQQMAAIGLATVISHVFVRQQASAPVTVDGQVLYNRPAVDGRHAV